MTPLLLLLVLLGMGDVAHAFTIGGKSGPAETASPDLQACLEQLNACDANWRRFNSVVRHDEVYDYHGGGRTTDDATELRETLRELTNQVRKLREAMEKRP